MVIENEWKKLRKEIFGTKKEMIKETYDYVLKGLRLIRARYLNEGINENLNNLL